MLVAGNMIAKIYYVMTVLVIEEHKNQENWSWSTLLAVSASRSKTLATLGKLMCSKTRNWVRILMTAMSYYRSVFACGSKLF